MAIALINNSLTGMILGFCCHAMVDDYPHKAVGLIAASVYITGVISMTKV